jgi:hypothetical protein
LRFEAENRKRREDHELYLAVERIKIADFKNAHFRKKDKSPLNLEPEDIFRISTDKTDDLKGKGLRMTPEEVERKYGKKGKK